MSNLVKICFLAMFFLSLLSMAKTVEKDRVTQIYVLKDPSTNSVRYVGKTVNSLSHRWSQHLSDSKRTRRHTSNWINSLISSGKVPIMECIDQCDWETSQTKEQHWIQYFKYAGYHLTNLTSGGEGNLGNKASLETIKKRQTILRSRSKKVYQYALSGNLVGEFNSAKEASEELGYRYTNIVQCCLNEKKSHRGFMWSYEPNSTSIYSPNSSNQYLKNEYTRKTK